MSRVIRHNPHRVDIRFSEAELAHVRRLAQERQEPKNRTAVARDKRIVGRDNVQTHFVGLLGECAFAKFMAVQVDRSCGIHGDPGGDFALHGVRIEVKTYLGYLAFSKLADFVADVAVLVTRERDEVARVTLEGWITRAEFAANCFADDFGYGRRLCVQPRDLHPMSRLAAYCQSNSR